MLNPTDTQGDREIVITRVLNAHEEMGVVAGWNSSLDCLEEIL